MLAFGYVIKQVGLLQTYPKPIQLFIKNLLHAKCTQLLYVYGLPLTANYNTLQRITTDHYAA